MINKINFTGNYTRKSQDNKKRIAKTVALSSICFGAGVLALKLAKGKKPTIIQDVFESRESIGNAVDTKVANVLEDRKNSVDECVVAAVEKFKDTFKNKVNSTLNEGKRLFVTNDLKVHDISDKSLDLSKICDNGTLMVKNKSGLVEIKYKDGDIVESFINGKLLKSYEIHDIAEVNFASKEFQTGSHKVKEILKFTPAGEQEKQTFLAYVNDGRLKRKLVYDFNKDFCKAIDFSQSGKPYIFSNYHCAKQPWLEKQEIYSEDGSKLKKMITFTKDGYRVSEIKEKRVPNKKQGSYRTILVERKPYLGYSSQSFVNNYATSSEIQVQPFPKPNAIEKTLHKVGSWLNK